MYIVHDESATAIQMLPSQQGKVYTAVRLRDKSSSSFQATTSTSSSMDELERYQSLPPASQPDDSSLSQQPHVVQTHTPLKVNKRLNSQTNNNCSTSLLTKALGCRSMSATHTRRSMTPPALLNKRISEPYALDRGGYRYNSLPLNSTPFRPVSSVLGGQDGQQSPSGLIGDDEHRDDEIQSEVFQQSSQPEDTGMYVRMVQ